MMILGSFLALKFGKQWVETYLAALNKRYYENQAHQQEACSTLQIAEPEFQKTLAYSQDKYRFSLASSWIQGLGGLAFLGLGGLGFLERTAQSLCEQMGLTGSLSTGLAFFGLLGGLSVLTSLPFSYFYTFRIEEKHGFNRQSVKGFFLDQVKGLFVGTLLGGLLLAGLLTVMDKMGDTWWLWAWGVMSGFSLLAMWLYPTFLAPLFNKFSPLEKGPLQDGIFALAKKVDFKTAGIFIMDASRRSSHGNAYFTGIFGEKRIVLFDTLVKSLTPEELVAVLAHELGHCKLHHIRNALLRSIVMTGGIFFLLSLCWKLDVFYHAFGLQGTSPYGALVVFSLWFGLVDFFLTPMGSWISRRNEFAADAFALHHIESPALLCTALIKLRESNHGMPIAHPLFSFFYYSHPPLLERLAMIR